MKHKRRNLEGEGWKGRQDPNSKENNRIEIGKEEWTIKMNFFFVVK